MNHEQTNHALRIEGLGKRYAGFALEDVSLEIPAGLITGLIGPNGAGKTTLIKLIMGLIHADGGRIEVFGLDNASRGPEIRRRIGYVPDEPTFFDDASLDAHRRAFAPFYDRWDDDRFEALASEFELPLKKQFKTLSQGMRIKFAIALALAHEPDLLIMDEPTTGLDPVFRRSLLRRLSEYIADGERTVLFSTHITADLEATADLIAFINDGSLVFAESIEQIHDRYATVRGGELGDATDTSGFVGVRRGSYGFEALTADVASLRPADTWVVEPATLEEILYFSNKGDTHVSNHHS